MTLFAEGEIGNLVPFIRAGYSTGSGGGPALLNRMVAGGIGIKGLFGYDNDVLGLGVGWGQRDVGKIDTDFDGVVDTDVGDIHQVSTEVFYKMQLTREVAVTPHMQIIFNPALDPGRDYSAVFGLRAKFAL